MTNRLVKACAGLLLLFAALSQRSFGSAMMPCLKATASRNAHFLVLVERQEGSREISLQVFPKEPWVNEKDKLNAPGFYWTDFMRWSVIFDPQKLTWESCPLPLITDDGEFLIILDRDTDLPDREALRIYRRRDHIGDLRKEGPDHGVFIKAVLFKDILSPDRIKRQEWSDSTPQWFVGSRFDFSDDNRKLIYKSDGKDGIHIDLIDGTIER